jgi:preprotein translocase subunit SecD
MLHFSRIKVAAILLTVLIVCGFAVPNFFPEETVKGWPTWAQWRVVLGPDLQGGTSLVLEVDRSDVRDQLLKSLRKEVRGALHDAHINLVNPPALRGNGVEVRLREGDFPAGFAALHELSQPFNGVSYVDVVDAGGGLIRLAPSEASINEHARLTIDQSIPIIERRFNELGVGLVQATVERQGTQRILVQLPRLVDPRQLLP